MKAAGNPKRVTRWPQRSLEVEQYWLTQYGRVVAFNSGAAGAGIFTAAVLSVPSTANLLRSVANMTYFYGYKGGYRVEADDVVGVLALWLNKEAGDTVGQSIGLMDLAYDQLKNNISLGVPKVLAELVAKKLSAKLATQAAAGAVPVVSIAVMAVIFTRDFRKIQKAIIDFYDAKAAPEAVEK